MNTETTGGYTHKPEYEYENEEEAGGRDKFGAVGTHDEHAEHEHGEHEHGEHTDAAEHEASSVEPDENEGAAEHETADGESAYGSHSFDEPEEFDKTDGLDKTKEFDKADEFDRADETDTLDESEVSEPAGTPGVPSYEADTAYAADAAESDDPADVPGVPYEHEESDLPGGPLADLPHDAADEQSAPVTDPATEPLLASTSTDDFLTRWADLQGSFIEDPHRSVTEADALLTEVLTAYQQAIEQRREQISSALGGNTTDTEKMRLALLDYRNVIKTMLETQHT